MIKNVILESIVCAKSSMASNCGELLALLASSCKHSWASCILEVIELHIDSNMEVAVSFLCLGWTVSRRPVTSTKLDSQSNVDQGTLMNISSTYPSTNSRGRNCCSPNSLRAYREHNMSVNMKDDWSPQSDSHFVEKALLDERWVKKIRGILIGKTRQFIPVIFVSIVPCLSICGTKKIKDGFANNYYVELLWSCCW